MSDIKIIEGDLNAGSARFAIVASRFNSFVVDRLLDGALDALSKHGVQDQHITVIKVPGAFELPLVISKVIAQDKFDSVIALGAVIRGGTPHFEYVAGECVNGLGRVSLDSGIPVVFGVLTVDTIEQAMERAGTDAGSNKGAEAALTALETLSVLRKLEE